MKVAVAQINPVVGDLPGNVERCRAAADTARSLNADWIALPEMAVPGYPPRDILFDAGFVNAVYEATEDLARLTRNGPPVVVGTILPSGRRPPGHPGLYNAAVLLDKGRVQPVAFKQLLPGYDVFYEPRWFLPGPPLPPVEMAGMKVGFLVCEDMWDEGYDIHPPAGLLHAGADLLVCLAASPYYHQVMERRLRQARRHACKLLHVNLWGANDELIFDGQSFAIDAAGKLIAWLPAFEEAVHVIDLDSAAPMPVAHVDPAEQLFDALVLGVRDFARKNDVARAFLGLSGGIDSAVVAVIAAQALGPDNVTAVAIPSRYSDERSTLCAEELALALGIRFEAVQLERLHAEAESTLERLPQRGTTGENIQARLRALILMAYVNAHGGMLLNTSNKTELALGYATLYGDMAGTLCPIADVTKPQVIALARWINANRCPIPRFVLERAPSAELRLNQVDPFDYEKVAPEMEDLVRADRSNPALRRSEHKRWQMGVILKVTRRAFGTGRMIPITRR